MRLLKGQEDGRKRRKARTVAVLSCHSCGRSYRFDFFFLLLHFFSSSYGRRYGIVSDYKDWNLRESV